MVIVLVLSVPLMKLVLMLTNTVVHFYKLTGLSIEKLLPDVNEGGK